MPPETFRLLLDENVPVQVLAWLRDFRPQWRIEHTSETGLNGRPDHEIFQWAQDHSAIVVTFDEDFADIRNFDVGHGVIRLRVWPTTSAETIAALSRLFSTVTEQELQEALVIVDRNRIRVRPR